MALNPQTGEWEDDDALMVPDWAPESPPVQIEAPQSDLDALAGVGQPAGDGGGYLPPVEGPDEYPGDRAPGFEQPYDDQPLPGAPGTPSAAAGAVPMPEFATAAPPQLEPVEFTPTPTGGGPELAVPEKPAGARSKVTQTVQSPEMNAVNADAGKLADAKATAERNAGVVRQQDIAAQQAHAAEETARALEKKKATEDLLKDHDARLAAATARNDAALEQWKGAKIHDYWSDKTTGDRILAAISVFLGGLGTAYGGENTAMKNLQSNIARDYERQKDEIEKKHSFFGETSKSMERAEALKARALIDLNLKFAAGTEAAAAKLAELKLKNGVPEDQVKTDKNVLAIYESANEFKQRSAKDTNARVEWDTYNKARAGRGGGAGGGNGSLTELARMAQQGASQAELIEKAERLGIKDPLGVVTKIQKDPEKLAAMEVRDAQGNVIGLASSTRSAKVAGDQIAAIEAYKSAIHEYAAHIRQNGRQLNPFSDDYKERERLHGDVVARGRKAMDLGVSNKNLELEHQIVGGSGAGLSRMSSPESLDKMAEEADRVAKTRIATGLRTGQRVGDGGTLPNKAPKSDDDTTRRERLRQAAEAIKPNSGATAAQRTRARQILQELGAR